MTHPTIYIREERLEAKFIMEEEHEHEQSPSLLQRITEFFGFL
ncbi:MAG: hypothetical protein V1854_02115 [Methanobacteriota archaeon]